MKHIPKYVNYSLEEIFQAEGAVELDRSQEENVRPMHLRLSVVALIVLIGSTVLFVTLGF